MPKTAFNGILEFMNNLKTNPLRERQRQSFIETEVINFIRSNRRKRMKLAEDYYLGQQKILTKIRQGVGSNGEKSTAIRYLPNTKIVDNMYSILVDQKTNYLLGKPLTVECDDESYVAKINEIFDERFHKIIRRVGMESINMGVSWLHPYISKDGILSFKRFSATEIIPYWNDIDKTELDMAIRVYQTINYDQRGGTSIVDKVEVYTTEGIEYFELTEGRTLTSDYSFLGNGTVSDSNKTNYLSYSDGLTTKEVNWDKIPLIAFRQNPHEMTLLSKVQSLLDALNQVESNFVDNILEDPRNTLLVLVNYDGEDLEEFRRNLYTYGAVKVKNDEGSNGDVKTLTIQVNAENYKAVIDILKKAILTNGRGYDAKDERMNTNPNQLNIRSMYSDVDLDANMMETEYQSSFKDVLWFINTHLKLVDSKANIPKVKILINRDILINESNVINDIVSSVGIISNKTLIAQHPYITNVNKEIKLMEEQVASELETEIYPPGAPKEVKK